MTEYGTGFSSVLGGQHMGIDPLLLSDKYFRKGVNLSLRGGIAGTRPKWKEIAVSNTGFTTGLFQGATLYHQNTVDRIVVVVAGRVMAIKLDDASVEDHGVLLDPDTDRVYFCQVDKYMVIQDGINSPVILNVNVAYQPDPATDSTIPRGFMMAYGHSRLFVVVDTVDGTTNLGRRYFVAGNVLKPNDPDYDGASIPNVITFTETNYLSGGGAMGLPEELGFIQVMGFLRNAKSGDGLGELIVFAQYGVSAFSVQASRTQWQDIDLSQVLFSSRSCGATGSFSLANVNADLFYRARDGIRSLYYSAYALTGGMLADEPISNEMRDSIEADTIEQTELVSGAVCNSRFFITAHADTNNGCRVFKAVISMDMSIYTEKGSSESPVYNGIWTGLDVTRILVGMYEEHETLFALARDSGGSNRLFYLDEYDETEHADLSDTAPVCRLYTKAHSFVDSNDNAYSVDLSHANIWLRDIRGDLAVTIYYRPYAHPFWREFGSFTIAADETGAVQTRRSIIVPIASSPAADSITSQSVKIGRDFEFCIEWTGHAKIYRAMFYGNVTKEMPEAACKVSAKAAVKLEAVSGEIELDDLDYRIV